MPIDRTPTHLPAHAPARAADGRSPPPLPHLALQGCTPSATSNITVQVRARASNPQTSHVRVVRPLPKACNVHDQQSQSPRHTAAQGLPLANRTRSPRPSPWPTGLTPACCRTPGTRALAHACIGFTGQGSKLDWGHNARLASVGIARVRNGASQRGFARPIAKPCPSRAVGHLSSNVTLSSSNSSCAVVPCSYTWTIACPGLTAITKSGSTAIVSVGSGGQDIPPLASGSRRCGVHSCPATQPREASRMRVTALAVPQEAGLQALSQHPKPLRAQPCIPPAPSHTVARSACRLQTPHLLCRLPRPRPPCWVGNFAERMRLHCTPVHKWWAGGGLRCSWAKPCGQAR